MKKEKRKKQLLVLAFVLLGFVALVGAGIWLKFTEPVHKALFNNLPIEKNTEKMTDKELRAYAQKSVDSSQVTVQVFSDIYMDETGQTGTFWVKNPPTNTLGQQAKLKLKATGEEIFDSGLIRPGRQIRALNLAKPLPKGEYESIIDLYFYNLTTHLSAGQTKIQALIHVP